ncbi:MAG: hypothetical protein ABW007_01285, partial [Chitinophagaceae bacterium]
PKASEGTKKLSEPARQTTNIPYRRVFFCAGDTLPFLAIFSSALIFFCYFFCIKAKKVIRDFDPSSKKKAFCPPAKGKWSLRAPLGKTAPLPARQNRSCIFPFINISIIYFCPFYKKKL